MFKKEMSVSFHIGSKNNAIPNLKKLKTIFIHNLRKYEKSNNPDLDLNLSQYNIILQGTNNLVEDVKKLYKNEFSEAVYNYNQKQSREDRKIINYLNKIEEDKQKNIATEIIMQLGDKEDWQNIDLQDKKKMAEVFKNSLNVLENKGFKVANAVLHLDETSPHLHIIGVPVGIGFKKGMEKQVSSKSVFSLNKLDTLRDEIEKTLIEDFNKVYNTQVEKKQEKALLQEHLSVTDYKKLKPVISELVKVVDKNTVLEEIKGNLKEKEKEIKEVKDTINYNDSLKEKLVADVEAKTKEVEELKAILKKKDDIKEQFYKNDSYIFDLKNKTDEQKKEIEAKEKTLKDLEKENKSIQEDIAKEWDIRNSIRDKELKISELKLEYAEKTDEFEKAEKKVKEQENFLLEYRIKISNFNSDKEELEEKVKVAEKEKEEEEKKLESKRKELAEIIANRKNIDFDLNEEKRKEEEKKKNNEKIIKLNAELEEQKERIKTLENNITANIENINKMVAEEKEVAEKQKKLDEKKIIRVAEEKEKELQKVLKRISKIDEDDIYYCFGRLERFREFEHEYKSAFKNDVERYFIMAESEIKTAKRFDSNVIETIEDFIDEEIFEKMKQMNEIAIEDYGFKDDEKEIDKGRGYGDY